MEGLAVFDANKLAVMAGQQIHPVVEFVDGEKYALLAFAFSRAKLRAIGEDGLAAMKVGGMPSKEVA